MIPMNQITSPNRKGPAGDSGNTPSNNDIDPTPEYMLYNEKPPEKLEKTKSNKNTSSNSSTCHTFVQPTILSYLTKTSLQPNLTGT